MTDLYLVLVMFLGGMLHLIGSLAEESKLQNKRIGFLAYQKKYPYQILYGLISSVCCYLIIWKMGELNTVSAMAAGYMGDSLVKKFMGSVNLKTK